ASSSRCLLTLAISLYALRTAGFFTSPGSPGALHRSSASVVSGSPALGDAAGDRAGYRWQQTMPVSVRRCAGNGDSRESARPDAAQAVASGSAILQRATARWEA